MEVEEGVGIFLESTSFYEVKVKWREGELNFMHSFVLFVQTLHIQVTCPHPFSGKKHLLRNSSRTQSHSELPERGRQMTAHARDPGAGWTSFSPGQCIHHSALCTLQ